MYVDAIGRSTDKRFEKCLSVDGSFAEARTANHHYADARMIYYTSGDSCNANFYSADICLAHCALVNTHTVRLCVIFQRIEIEICMQTAPVQCPMTAVFFLQ